MDALTIRFIRGLQEHNLTPEILKASNWRYCGGTQPGTHLSYWRLRFGSRAFPEYESACVCGHEIKYNCFITDGENILVLGNCCIKKFVSKSGRNCDKCGATHRNRIIDRCNACRNGKCDRCGVACGMDYKRCISCATGRAMR